MNLMPYMIKRTMMMTLKKTQMKVPFMVWTLKPFRLSSEKGKRTKSMLNSESEGSSMKSFPSKKPLRIALTNNAQFASNTIMWATPYSSCPANTIFILNV